MCAVDKDWAGKCWSVLENVSRGIWLEKEDIWTIL